MTRWWRFGFGRRFGRGMAACCGLLWLLLLLTAAQTQPPTTASAVEAEGLWRAYQSRYQKDLTINSNDPLATLFEPVLDHAFISPDGKTGVLWLALKDHTGRILATEPGLVLAVRENETWRIVYSGESEWQQIKASLPASFLPASFQSAPENQLEQTINAPITGYYLPYVAGTKHRLEGSVLHFNNYPALGYPSCEAEFCRYAYDFTDSGHFPLVASKAGVVISSKDSCYDGSTACTNYIVLQDVVGGAYQIYLHLAHNTIPDHLTYGAYIGRGNYIGDTDDTGYSTSEHVHFMVTTSFWLSDPGETGYPWGRSVDMRFADVTINGGIPRTCYEVTHLPIYDNATQCIGTKTDPLNPQNDWFVSGNQGASPPSGQLTRPVDGAVVAGGSNPLMDVTAQTSDDVRVVRAVLQAKINGAWTEIGPQVTTPSSTGVFDWDVNLCQAGPLNGPLEVALKLWDHEGNVVGLLSKRTINIDHACPPPVSQMTAPTTYDGTALKLNWTSSESGVPISFYQLQWRAGQTAWSTDRMISLAPTNLTTWFVGAAGGSYGFRLRAIDANSQAEPWLANDAAEVTVSLPATCTGDAFEQDDSAATAEVISLASENRRNICATGDEDWFKVTLGEYKAIKLVVTSLGGGAAVKVSVYAPDAQTLLSSASSPQVASGVSLWVHVGDLSYVLVKAEAAFANLSGTAVTYALTAIGGYSNFVPLIFTD